MYWTTCIGGLLFVAGLFLLFRTIFFLMRAETAEGEIVDYDSSGSSEESTSDISSALVRFTTKQGQTVEFSGLDSFGPLSFVTDLFASLILNKDINKVAVAYDPNNPKRARIKNFINLYLWPVLLIILAAIVWVGGFAMVAYLFKLL